MISELIAKLNINGLAEAVARIIAISQPSYILSLLLINCEIVQEIDKCVMALFLSFLGLGVVIAFFVREFAILLGIIGRAFKSFILRVNAALFELIMSISMINNLEIDSIRKFLGQLMTTLVLHFFNVIQFWISERVSYYCQSAKLLYLKDIITKQNHICFDLAISF